VINVARGWRVDARRDYFSQALGKNPVASVARSSTANANGIFNLENLKLEELADDGVYECA